MAKDAFYFLIPLSVAAATSFLGGWTPGGFVLAALAAFVAFFFRDPRREIPSGPGLVVSPADGRVVRIQEEGGRTRISVFLSLFNVHVNRSPISGRIAGIRYRRGRFRAAFNHLASVENEQNTMTIDGDDGDDGEGITIECSQIAGVVARRIVCWRREGEHLDRGERYGLIRFGSRADIVVPRGVQVTVAVGDRVRGGSSIIARLGAREDV
jgi:phosphatidylserine decarboxylase